jgi:hypothetical protein
MGRGHLGVGFYLCDGDAAVVRNVQEACDPVGEITVAQSENCCERLRRGSAEIFKFNAAGINLVCKWGRTTAPAEQKTVGIKRMEKLHRRENRSRTVNRIYII